MPDHYRDRVAAFNAEPIVPGKIIFLGNSITEMGPWQLMRPQGSILNRGIGGDVSFSILSRLNDITARRPSKLFLMAGINDLSKEIPEDVILGNCRKIIEKLRKGSPATIVYMQSVLPVNPLNASFPKGYNKKREIESLNKQLVSLAGSLHVKYINLYPLFADSAGSLKEGYTSDGLHLNQKGYDIWVDYLKKEKYL
jgi:lysophospholipase L1-like esterase